MVCFLLMDTAPLARQVVTIMGSISRVGPTAMEMPRRKAPIGHFIPTEGGKKVCHTCEQGPAPVIWCSMSRDIRPSARMGTVIG